MTWLYIETFSCLSNNNIVENKLQYYSLVFCITCAWTFFSWSASPLKPSKIRLLKRSWNLGIFQMDRRPLQICLHGQRIFSIDLDQRFLIYETLFFRIWRKKQRWFCPPASVAWEHQKSHWKWSAQSCRNTIFGTRTIHWYTELVISIAIVRSCCAIMVSAERSMYFKMFVVLFLKRSSANFNSSWSRCKRALPLPLLAISRLPVNPWKRSFIHLLRICCPRLYVDTSHGAPNARNNVNASGPIQAFHNQNDMIIWLWKLVEVPAFLLWKEDWSVHVILICVLFVILLRFDIIPFWVLWALYGTK